MMDIILSITVVAFGFLIILQAYKLDEKQNYILLLQRKINEIINLNTTKTKKVIVERTETLQ